MGNRPLIVFQGEHWESTDELRTIKSIFLDMYTGDHSADRIDLQSGITHTMIFTLVGLPSSPCRILLNVYTIELKKNEDDALLPKVEMTEVGPFIEFVQRRTTMANMDMMKESLRVPKLNVVRDSQLIL
jgi:ribosome production factor 2